MTARSIMLGLALLVGMANMACERQVGAQRRSEQAAAVTTPSPSPSQKPRVLCGAPTRKGTACRKPVKVAGERCWMHRETVR